MDTSRIVALDRLYARLLHVGFIVLRQAVDSRDDEWINSELELLHNLPSLIGETNAERHRYFWERERLAYLEWVSTSGPAEAASRMRTYYEPVWDEMRPLVP